MDFGLLAAANQGLSTIKNIAEAYVGVRDQAKLLDLRIEMQSAVISLQSTVLALLQKQGETEEEKRLLVQAKNQLEETVRSLEAKQAQKDSLELYELRPGKFVYSTKPQPGHNNMPPYFCQLCRDAGATSVLRHIPDEGLGNYEQWICAFNNAHTFSHGAIEYRSLGRQYNPYA